MNDLKWRTLENDEDWALLRSNKDNMVIVQTNVALRIGFAKHIDMFEGRLVSAKENVIAFAFIEEYKEE